MIKPNVYLAGGMGSGWQDDIIKKFEGKFNFFNPRDHHLDAPEEYTNWDLFFVSKCDILFGYMEKDNPSGFGLTLEIGYAKALDKTIILTDARSTIDEVFSKRFNIVRESATVIYQDLESSLKFLERFSAYSI
ncbi:nucleoside 2-deoxyribosyltransferase domain-containing protein [Labilibacter marinus]|uniref:nucleoside 2-deoxyribosyltransferase domain-containing protein n=1 Tax=Labilibacter marinus TaxID=1477105 RepID=UPI0009502E05|nr:nucleoside 2-deoxyribosyltransferase domain-containing protein [Labilibacter marinus]